MTQASTTRGRAKADNSSAGLSPLGRHVLIRASAGTGKTYQLSSRYLHLLRTVSPDRILATTFTRKAAGEILERVLTRLAAAVLNEQALRQLSGSLGKNALDAEECRQMLSVLCRQLHRVRIGTLDSYFAQVAGSYALELGFPLGWKIADPSELAAQNVTAIDLMLDSSRVEDVIQLMHLLDRDGPSRGVADRILRAVNDLYEVFLGTDADCWQRDPPSGMLTDATLQEIVASLETVTTADSRLAKAITSDCAKVRSGQWDKLLEAGLVKGFAEGKETYYGKPLPATVLTAVSRLLEHCRSRLLTAWFQQTAASRQLLDQFQAELARLQQRDGSLGFGDITRGLVARSGPVGSQFRLNSAVSHLLLDEFQDTSPAQWDVLRPLANAVVADEHGSFFCVGDSKQAIYGWRGGEAALFDTITQELPGLHAESLDRSYRSSPVIMDAVNLAMTRLDAHPDYPEASSVLEDWVRSFPQHSTARTSLPGFVELRTTGDPQAADKSAKDDVSQDPHWRDVAEIVADLSRQSPAATIGVLTRANDAVGTIIYELQRLGVSASEEGGNPLTDSAAVRLVLAMLTLADHPGNTIARFHVSKSPLGSLAEFASVHSESGAQSFSQRIRSQLADAGYAAWMRSLGPHLAAACNAREWRRFQQLLGLAEEYDATSPSLRAADFVNLARQQRRQEPSAARVRVMTVHQSKGLEFDIVVLPELDAQLVRMSQCKYVTRTSQPGTPPNLVALFRDQQMFKLAGADFEEARQQTLDRMLREALCVLYVAMTRAVHALHLVIRTSNAAKLPKTSAGLLRAALDVADVMAPNQTLWSKGDQQWSANVNWSAGDNSTSTLPSQAQSLTDMRFSATPQRRHVRLAQPSQLHQSPGWGSLRLHLGGSLAMDRGTLFHHWLERIAWVEDIVPSVKELCAAANDCGLPLVVVEQAAHQFQTLLGMPPMRTYLSQSGCHEQLAPIATAHEALVNECQLHVWNEWRFTELHEGLLLNGSIDRLVTLEANGKVIGAQLTDYKTDALGPAEELLNERTEFHRPQLLAYRDCLLRFFQLQPADVIVNLVFLQTGRVVEVECSKR